MGDVVADTDREMLLRPGLLHLGDYGHHHCRRELLRRQAVAAADDARHRGARAVSDRFRERGDDILVERLAARTGLLGAVEHGNHLHGVGQRREEVLRGERPVQPHVHHADAFGMQGVDRLCDGVGA